jgi:hypothetical protein
MQRGPLAALFILLGLVLGSGPATANASGIAAPAARSALGRQGPASALLHSSLRSSLDDHLSGSDTPPVVPPQPAIVTALLRALPATTPFAAIDVPPAQPGALYYRARAPPPA